uniref:Uncharacterized protein n=1 Tax=Fagus sylvatica TaxID=28930 RepID=A0A2N9IRM8_FAGSY
MGHASYRRKALDVYFPTIPIKRGKLPANRELHVIAGVVIFPTHPGLRINLQQVRKDSAREGGSPDVGFRRTWYHRKACATLSCQVSELWETELGVERYGPANRGRRSVFGLSEGIFPAPHRGELGSARYDLVNGGRWNVPYSTGSFSDRDSGLTGGALDDPGVARCS